MFVLDRMLHSFLLTSMQPVLCQALGGKGGG